MSEPLLIGVAALIAFAAALWLASIPLRRRARRQAATGGRVKIGSKTLPLDLAAWTLASTIGPSRVTELLSEGHPKNQDAASRLLEKAAAELSDEDRRVLAERSDLAEQARADRALWSAQNEAIGKAAATVGVDALVIAAAADPWATGLMEGALQHVDVSQVVIDHLLNNRYDHYFGLFHHQLFEHAATAVDHVAGGAIDAGLGAGEHLLGAVAEMHLPVVTITRSIHRAMKASQNGLDSARVQENLAIDLVAKGGGLSGGAATGALIGGFFFPVVGHAVGGLIGGLIGGFAGSAVAEDAKSAHYNDARNKAHQATSEVGRSIPSDVWSDLVTRNGQLFVARLSEDLDAVHTEALRSTRGMVPSLTHYILTAAASAGEVQLAEARAEQLAWVTNVRVDTDYERGVAIMLRSDLRSDRVSVNSALTDRVIAANRLVGEERHKLALAAG